MNKTVTIQGRAIKSQGYGNVDYTEKFTTTITVRAAVETTRGYQTFNDVGVLQNVITHKIYIRYPRQVCITSEDWVDIDCVKYDIVDVENPNEENQWLILYCTRKGDSKRVANFV